MRRIWAGQRKKSRIAQAMADDAAGAMEQEEEDEEEEEEDEDEEGEDEDEEDEEEDPEDEDERKKDAASPSLVEGQDGARADLSGPLSMRPAAPAAVAAAAAVSASFKEMQQVEVELRLLEALEIYHPAKLQGMHRHFILYGLMEYLERRLNHHFTANEILELLDRFYNLELLKPDDEEMELLGQEEEFSLPASILAVKEEPRENL